MFFERKFFNAQNFSEFNFSLIKFDDYTTEQIKNNDAEEHAKEVDAIKKLEQQDTELEYLPSNICLLNPGWVFMSWGNDW